MKLRRSLGAFGRGMALVVLMAACSSTTPPTVTDSGSPGLAPVSSSIGPTGGSVAAGEVVTLTIPANALPSATNITLSVGGASPAGASRFSEVVTFEPAATTFKTPATVSFGFTGDAARAAVFWSSSDGATWEKLATTVVGGRATASITHFSRGFVGDGAGTFPGLAGGGAKCGASFTEGCFGCYQRACPTEFAKCFGDKPAPGAIVGACKSYGECVCACTSPEDCKKCSLDATCGACNESSGLFTCATKACASACGG
ncbi:MAG: hypothetical protein IPF92_23925 [Myxococcales bacterium]|nr:hypothetical protein [Myxococcales bacterium]MBL0194883.1 hypothetical protein [Myxococcales bacterium]